MDFLKEYIDSDDVYQQYKAGKLTNPSDYEKFCIERCENIDALLYERACIIEWLKSQIDFLEHIPAFTKEIKREHCIMKNCYQDILDLYERGNNENDI